MPDGPPEVGLTIVWEDLTCYGEGAVRAWVRVRKLDQPERLLATVVFPGAAMDLMPRFAAEVTAHWMWGTPHEVKALCQQTDRDARRYARRHETDDAVERGMGG